MMVNDSQMLSVYRGWPTPQYEVPPIPNNDELNFRIPPEELAPPHEVLHVPDIMIQ